MDTKLLLVKCVSLLWLEAQQENKATKSTDLVKEAIEFVKMPEQNITISEENIVISGLKTTTDYVSNMSPTDILDRDDLLQRLKINCAHDSTTYDAIESIINKDYSASELNKKIISFRNTIRETIRVENINKLIRQAASDLTFNPDKIKDIDTYISSHIANLEKMGKGATKKELGVVSAVNFSDDQQLEKIITEAVDLDNDNGIIKTGWQDINIALQGGFRRGEQWVFPALQHKYKTGFSLTIFKQALMYNTPYMLD